MKHRVKSNRAGEKETHRWIKYKTCNCAPRNTRGRKWQEAIIEETCVFFLYLDLLDLVADLVIKLPNTGVKMRSLKYPLKKRYMIYNRTDCLFGVETVEDLNQLNDTFGMLTKNRKIESTFGKGFLQKKKNENETKRLNKI